MKRIIFDTDIGDDIDDAFALTLAVKSKQFDILGVTTTYKNSLQRAKIAKKLLNELNQDIPVYMGIDKPSNTPIKLMEFEKIGVDGKPIISQYFSNMANEKTEEISAVDFILQQAEKYPGEITLVCLAPLTNVAQAIKKDENRFNKLKELLIMGGCYGVKYAEWNFRCDVDATYTVFNSKVPIRAVGYEITRFSSLSIDQIDKVYSIKRHNALKSMLKTYINCYNGERIPTMHDPLTIGSMLIDGYVFEPEKIKIITSGEFAGQTIYDNSGKECLICKTADVGKFLDYLMKKIVD